MAMQIGGEDLATILKSNYENEKLRRINIIVEGPPGVGKTAVIKQVSEELAEKYPGFFLNTFIVSTRDPVSIMGTPVPFRDDDFCRWLLPEEIHSITRPNARGIFFLDELGNGTADMQKAVQNMIHAREINGLKISDGVMFVAATNCKKDRAGSIKLLSALSNRFERHEMLVDHVQWARVGQRLGFDVMVLTYIHKNPGDLFQFNPEKDINATPRSWERVSNILQSDLPEAIKHLRIVGNLDEAIASKFWAHFKLHHKLPDFEDVESGKPGTPVPDGADLQGALALALAYRASSKTFNTVIEYVNKFSNKELAVLFVKQAIDLKSASDPQMRECSKYTAFLLEHKLNILNHHA